MLETEGVNNLSSVSKKIQIRTKKKILGVVRENYLRSDIPCRSELCFENCDSKTTDKVAKLCADCLHYVVPLPDVVSKYLDLFDQTFFKGIIFTQTLVNIIQQKKLKDYRKICNYVRDPGRCSIFFVNEFFKETYVNRQTNESLLSWTTRMIHKTGLWYYQHLGGQKPIVYITEDPNVTEQLTVLSKNIAPDMLQVLSLEQYISLYSTNTEAMELYLSMSSTNQDADDNSKDFKEYIKTEVLEAGLRSGKYISGVLKVNKYLSSSEAYVTQSQTDVKFSGSDILILGANDRNRAVHADRVVVEVLARSEWRSKTTALVNTEHTDTQDTREDKSQQWKTDKDVMPTGRIVGILERNWRSYIATVPATDMDSMDKSTGRRVLVFPYDRRIPKIRVQTSQLKKLQGQRVVVTIDSWPLTSAYPQGHIVKSLGNIGHLQTEIDSILVENSIEVTPFSEGILAELPDLDSVDDWRPLSPEQSGRKDLRNILIMSIDPKGCEDVDDAISIRKLDNDDIELGVHIADVTHFVPFNSLTDLEARKRATTVYLADRRYDMLPAVLSAHLCSLLGSVERYAVSVIWNLHPTTYKVKNVWYGRTIIKSGYKLCYEDAQDIIDGKSAQQMQENIIELVNLPKQKLKHKFEELKTSLDLLTQVTSRWQHNRQSAGALNLQSTEVQFEFKESNPDKMKPKADLGIHETVAECMIMANHWVARKISAEFPVFSLLRLHPPPKQDSFDELLRCATSKGWTIDTKSNKGLAGSLDKCVDSHDPEINILLRSLATYAMVQAEYFSTGSVTQENWNHYGLALDKYTHFTSPIRRYADIIVHRLLMAAVTKDDWWDGKSNKKDNLFDNTQLKDLSQHINERNRAAQQAQRMSTQLFQTLYFKDLGITDPRCIVDGIVYSLRANGFLVHIPAYGLKGPVYLESKEKEVLYNGSHGLVWQRGVVTMADFSVKVETIDGVDEYRLFDHVTLAIQLKGSEMHGYELTYTLLEKAAYKPSGQPLSSDELKKSQEKGNSKDKSFNFFSATKDRLANQAEVDLVDEFETDPNLEATSNVYRFFQDMRILSSDKSDV